MHSLELLGTPIGTGTLYVVDPVNNDEIRDECSDSSHTENDKIEKWKENISAQNLIKEKRRLNRATETNESLVIQYLVQGGYKNLNTFDLENRSIFRVASSLHAGSGPLVWGMTGSQKCDLTLSFTKESDYQPAVVYFINYHGAYYHYNGHLDTCPSGNQSLYPFEPKPTDIVMDSFRRHYAIKMSCVYPENVRFIYDTVYECDFFHGNKSFSMDKGVTLFTSIKQAVESNPDHVYSKKYSNTYNVGKLIDGIQKGSITGFITIKGGQEAPSNDANDFFGFCVQNYTPNISEISTLTKNQMMHFKALKNESELEHYLKKKQIGLTLNSGTFHSEETISTEYLRWLLNVRNFTQFQVTHFIEYKFVQHSKAFLEPLLERRHKDKLAKDVVSAECLKLICNGSYGYNALESSNYNSCRLITATNLKKSQTNITAFLSLDRIQLIGVVKLTSKQKKQKTKTNDYLIDEAVEDSEEEEEDNDEKEFDFLYSVIVSGKERTIKNSLPKAVSILSNSKKLFLGHIQLMLECLDPCLAELCYIDTDSCIFSLTYSSIEECLKNDKRKLFEEKDILANENAKTSFHGKMKCEGIYKGGHFRTIKIYRLYSADDLYTRCKGVNRKQADKLPNITFDHQDNSINTIERRALRPTAAGEMCIIHESRSLACPINLKRYVMPDGVHTIPISLAQAWETM